MRRGWAGADTGRQESPRRAGPGGPWAGRAGQGSPRTGPEAQERAAWRHLSPRDDWWPRRTCEWKELGPKAKEWGTERLWSEWERRAFSLFVFNRELSTPGFSQILRLMAL